MSADDTPTGPNTYTCAVCHEIFEKGWTDEDAAAEKKELWGDVPDEYCAVVCDDCFKQMMLEHVNG